MVEMLAVVAMIGILAALATASVRKYVAYSKSTEAGGMFMNIKLQQEAYYTDTQTYLNVSSGLTAAASFYPANPTPGQAKMNFAGTGDGQANWQMLGVKADGPVYLVYACTAGAAGTTPTATGSDITVASWPSAAALKPWYVVKARGDLDADGVNSVFISASFVNETFSANN